MAGRLAKSPFVLLTIGVLILACPASQSDDDEFNLLNQQVQTLFKQGRYQEAIPLAEKAVELAKRVYGPEQPNTATSLTYLGRLYKAIGEYGKAEPLYQQALQIRQKVLGPEHPDTAYSLNNLTELYRVMGEYAKAEPLYQEALQIRQEVLGAEHPAAAASLNSLAVLYQDMGEYAEEPPPTEPEARSWGSQDLVRSCPILSDIPKILIGPWPLEGPGNQHQVKDPARKEKMFLEDKEMFFTLCANVVRNHQICSREVS